MATVTHLPEKPADTKAVAGLQLEQALEDVLRGVPPLMRKLMSRRLGQALAAVRVAIPTLDPHIRRDPYVALIGGAIRCIDRADNRIAEIDAHLAMQEAALRFASSPEERERMLVETSAFLRRTPAQLRGDRAAVRRFMDWDAVVELARRAQRSAWRYQQTLVFVASRALARCTPDRGRTAADVMERTGFAAAFHRAIQQRLPVHLEREWIDAVVAILKAQRNKKGVVIDPAILHALAVRGQNAHADVWVQCSSLYAWLIASPIDALRLVRQRLKAPDTKFRDDIFVRRFLVERTPEILDEMQTLDLIQAVLSGPDPSPHVRQGAVLALGDRDPDRSWPLLREHMLMKEEMEPVPEVRASVAITLGRWATKPKGSEIALQEWRLFFEREEDPMPLRMSMKHAGEALENLVGYRQMDGTIAEQFALELVEKGAQKGWPLPVRVAAEDMLERIRVAGFPSFPHYRDHVLPILLERNRMDQVDVSVDDMEFPDETFGRLLAWTARRHYGLYALPRRFGWRVTVGHQKRWRLWRFLHESREPAPDKRQAISHVRGRRYEGSLRAHSPGLGEESPTKVPGEPIQMMAEGGWRRFLPLPDDFLDSLEFGPVKVFSNEGIAYITPPEGRKARWKLWWRLSRAYPAMAALREQSRYGNAEVPPCAYVERMRAMGFGVSFRPHTPPEFSIAMPYFTPPQASVEPQGPAMTFDAPAEAPPAAPLQPQEGGFQVPPPPPEGEQPAGELPLT